MNNNMMIRTLDIVFSLLGLLLGLPVLIFLAVIGWFDTGSPFYCQTRVGRWQQPFVMLKFRTMRIGTASMATHLVDASVITPFGRILRKSKFDELPQLWNVLKGDMSLVGPRPCLFNQEELVRERAARGVFSVRPGVTGLAQLKDIDMSRPLLLAETDAEMVNFLNLRNYLRLIFLTVIGRKARNRFWGGHF